jgi:aspartate-semialdehyde dehydrogenase
LPVLDAADFEPTSVDVVFSALEADAAKEFEPRCAKFVPVLSTASAFRMESDVPILVPAVNSEHMPLIRIMQRKRGWRGFVAPGANCTTIGLAITLAPLQKAFGIRSVLMTSLQAVSGAGRSPGVIGLDIIDNVIPHIANEETKVQRETRKILGRLAQEEIVAANFPVGATCTRVPVLEGHTECVSVSLEKAATVAEVSEAMRSFDREFQQLGFPSTPQQLICVHTDPYRPQPRLDRDAEKGMTTHVGRIRECPALPNGISFVLVSHNTRMGAAGGSILTAEELQARGYFTT